MTLKSNKHSSLGQNRTSTNVWFLIVVGVLIALLLIMYIHNRSRRAEYERLQLEVTGSETVTELEPGNIEDATE